MKIPAKMIEDIEGYPPASLFFTFEESAKPSSLFNGTWEYLGKTSFTFKEEAQSEDDIVIPSDIDESTCYKISTRDDLIAFRDGINDGTIDLSTNAILTKDIDLTNDDGTSYEWAPVCIFDGSTSTTNGYKGIFDGLSHTVSGYIVNSNAMSEHTHGGAGLFSCVVGGTIRNLTTNGVVDVTGPNYSGGVCGYAGTSSTITNCSNTGSVTGSNYSGGVCGLAYTGVTITNCSNTGSVTGSNYSGGVCGCAYTSVTITNCSNTGSVTGSSQVGGVCGLAYTGVTITNCSNTGSVTGSSQVGGVCGRAYTSVTITNCSNTGSVTGSSLVGGVCGCADTSSTITNCSNTGSVTGSSQVGGVCGYADTSSTITNCTCYSDVTCNSSNKGESIGGLIGYLYIGSSSYVKCTNCAFSGTLIGIENAYAGWLYGYIKHGGTSSGNAMLYTTSCIANADCGANAMYGGISASSYMSFVTSSDSTLVDSVGDAAVSVLPIADISMATGETKKVVRSYPSDIDDLSKYIVFSAYTSAAEHVFSAEHSDGSFNATGVGGGASYYAINNAKIQATQFGTTSPYMTTATDIIGFVSVEGDAANIITRDAFVWERVE